MNPTDVPADVPQIFLARYAFVIMTAATSYNVTANAPCLSVSSNLNPKISDTRKLEDVWSTCVHH